MSCGYLFLWLATMAMELKLYVWFSLKKVSVVNFDPKMSKLTSKTIGVFSNRVEYGYTDNQATSWLPLNLNKSVNFL